MSGRASLVPVQIFLLSVILSGCSEAGQTDSSRVLSVQGYIDPKGFFSVTPPDGWEIQEYPNEAHPESLIDGPAKPNPMWKAEKPPPPVPGARSEVRATDEWEPPEST